MSDNQAIIQNRLSRACDALDALRSNPASLIRIADIICDALEDNGTVLTCGNGGSAAEALHLSEELIGRFQEDRPPHRSICLNADPTALTCIANDYGFEAVFSRQCQALAGPNDVLVVFSTSGNSANVVQALQVARSRGTTTIGLLGADGGEASAFCDHVLLAPGEDSAAIQECHQVALHAICNCLEPRQ
ncbi:MAG: SIS domain-containing protein [Phycisphaerales bacterium]|jgi:D-sedoheptulose 7-phosphate isomerase|nr:SIS domain-containing protein [Phycisphaerales bacterium]